MKSSPQTNIKTWYMRNYPSDDCGKELNESLTFLSLFNKLEIGKEFYALVEVRDSLVRERILEGLSEALDIPYKDIYSLWRNADS